MTSPPDDHKVGPAAVSASEPAPVVSLSVNDLSVAMNAMRFTPQSIDDIVARELKALNAETRNQIQEELHAVRSMAVRETPDFVANKLSELDVELDKLISARRTAMTTTAGGGAAANRGSRNDHPVTGTTATLIAPEMVGSGSHTQELYAGDNNTLSRNSSSFSFHSSPQEMSADGVVDTSMYEEAIRWNSPYVSSADYFRLPFLRRELFDATKAAKRICEFLNLIHDLFGEVHMAYSATRGGTPTQPPFYLMRPITIHDLTAEDMKVMKEGWYQVLPQRDVLGRRVYGLFGYPKKCPHMSWFRTLVYISMAVTEDVHSQQQGAVFIYHQMDPFSQVARDPIERRVVYRTNGALPIRVVGFHFCIPDNPLSQMIKATSMAVLGSSHRVRTKIHLGTTFECQYSLQSFGITSQMPVNNNSGEIKTKQHIRWLEFRYAKDDALLREWTNTPPVSGRKLNAFNGTDCPEHNTVLLGRGKPVMRHPGNIVLRDLIDQRLDEYDLASKQGKTQITREIIHFFKNERNTKFLKQDAPTKVTWWVEASDEEARLKVSAGFRDARKSRSTPSTSTSINSLAAVPAANVVNVAYSEAKGSSSKRSIPETEDSSTSIFVLSLEGRKRSRASDFCSCEWR